MATGVREWERNMTEMEYWSWVEELFFYEMEDLVAELERLGVEYGQEIG